MTNDHIGGVVVAPPDSGIEKTYLSKKSLTRKLIYDKISYREGVVYHEKPYSTMATI